MSENKKYTTIKTTLRCPTNVCIFEKRRQNHKNAMAMLVNDNVRKEYVLALVRMNRRAIETMFVRLSVCPSVWDLRVLWSYGALYRRFKSMIG